MDQFHFVQTLDGLGQYIIVAVALAAHRRIDLPPKTGPASM